MAARPGLDRGSKVPIDFPQVRRTAARARPQDEALYEDLRRWRLEAAGDRPAYHVASNRTLTAIATVKPLDEYSLMGVAGVGPAFMEKYGADVLRVVSRHD